MLGFVPADIPWNTISNPELRQSYKALRDGLEMLSTTTLGYIRWREYALTIDAIEKELSSSNKVRLPLDGWTSPNKLAITSVIE